MNLYCRIGAIENIDPKLSLILLYLNPTGLIFPLFSKSTMISKKKKKMSRSQVGVWLISDFGLTQTHKVYDKFV